MSQAVQRYVAFSDRPDGGNPADVVLDAVGLNARVGDLGVSRSRLKSDIWARG